MRRKVLSFVLIAIAMSFGTSLFRSKTANAQRPRAVMDFTSILNTLDVSTTDGTLQFNQKEQLFAAFVPDQAELDVVFRKLGEPLELHATNLGPREHYGKFLQARAIGSLDETRLTEPGDYLVTYRCNGVPVTRLRVTLNVHETNGKKSYHLSGPWRQWVQFQTPLKKAQDSTPKIVCWLKNESPAENQIERYKFQIRRDDRLVYEAEDALVSSEYWKPFTLELRFPTNLGGKMVSPIEFFNRNGNFEFQIRKGEKLIGVYPYKVEQGQFQYHPRQLMSHRPPYEYMITRFAGKNKDGSDAANVYWMERSSNVSSNHQAAVRASGSNSSFLTPQRRKNWRYNYSADPNRPFQLVETKFEVEDQSHIAVGDDLVVFGTGDPRGVAYINVGDEQSRTEPRMLPQANSFDSRLFCVCGKKIVLLKHKTMAVYDTTTESLTSVDANEILLYDASGGLYRSNMMHADGNLVAVVNDLGMVRDRRTIKVVDLGAKVPQIIALSNGKFIPPEISGIAVDAGQQIVVVASWQRKTIYYAKLEPNAKFVEIPLVQYGGINRKQFKIVDGGVLFADLDDNLRYLNLTDNSPPKRITDAKDGVGGSGFDSAGGRIALTSKKQSGTRFQIAVSNFPDSPKVLENTGRPIPGTTGEFGMAGRICVANDGTIFASGTPGGGIGIGEYLQVLHRDATLWHSIVGINGKPIQAIDVVTGVRMLAFKTGGYDEKSRIAFASFGDKIDASKLPTVENFINGGDELVEIVMEDLSEDDQALIKNYRKVENDLLKSFAAAIGQKRGADQARKAIVDVIKKNGDERLLQAYIQLTK